MFEDKHKPPSAEHPYGVAVCGTPIEPGLQVWTNEFEAGTVTSRPLSSDQWFEVRYPNGKTVLQDAQRVSTKLEDGHLAADKLRKSATFHGVEVGVYQSPVDPHMISVQIDTRPGTEVNVFLNDADLYRGNPEKIMRLVGAPAQAVVYAAFGLLGDGMGEEWGLNPEYTRAIVELVRDTCGLASGEHQDVLEFIRRHGDREQQGAPSSLTIRHNDDGTTFTRF